MDNNFRARVVDANKALYDKGLVADKVLTWGNASAYDKKTGLVHIKPSGVPYDCLSVEKIVAVNFQGKFEGKHKPSVDTPTHIELYKAFPEISGIVHTHSHYATVFAQVKMPIPCLGTTHADYFRGNIPISLELSEEEIEKNYEQSIGKRIAESLRTLKLNPLEIRAMLIPSHGIFTWGKTIEEALKCAVVAEEVARLAYHQILLERASGFDVNTPKEKLKSKHWKRMQGKRRYYGQEEKK